MNVAIVAFDGISGEVGPLSSVCEQWCPRLDRLGDDRHPSTDAMRFFGRASQTRLACSQNTIFNTHC